MNTTHPCGLHGCTNPTDPDSGIGRCQDCTLQFELEMLRLNEIDRKQRDARTRRAPLDALRIARAFLRDDELACYETFKDADTVSTTMQLAGWLRVAVQAALDNGAGAEFGDSTVDDLLAQWEAQVSREQQEQAS